MADLGEQIEKLQQLVNEAKRIVFFGGAGVSTESGIPDFRSASGLYNEKGGKYAYPPEVMLSISFFRSHTAEFYDFYREKMLYPNAKPNAAHYALAKLEKKGKLTAVVTQNIDDLHQQAGSKTVYQLHGSAGRNHCLRCGKEFDADYVKATEGVCRCSECLGVVKPSVVLYGEALPNDEWEGADRAIRESDLLIVGGTSLTVYPASVLPRYAGGKTVLINMSETDLDGTVDLAIHAKVGEVLGALKI